MTSSKECYNLYKGKRNKVKKYEESIKELRTVLSNLQDNLTDEISAVNKEINELLEDLSKGIRHNARFTSHCNAHENERERPVSADNALKTAISEIENEITRLTSLKNRAVSERDDYYRKYETAKEAERQERLDNLESIFF